MRCLILLLVAVLTASCAAPKPKPPKAPTKPPPPKEAEAAKPPKKPRPSPTEEVVAKLGDKVTSRLGRPFARAGVRFPPKRVHFLAFKQERLLELWAEDGGGPRFIRSYSILAASGKAGPKLVEGDLQVPEGVYRVIWLNPKSAYHLSLKLDYPNEFDRARAAEESRVNLGGDIFVHGRDASIGCLAMGDPAIEDLFVLTAQVGAENVRVVIAPNDLRSKSPPTDLRYSPGWLPELYRDLRRELEPFALR
jgi:hypothetical protein